MAGVVHHTMWHTPGSSPPTCRMASLIRILIPPSMQDGVIEDTDNRPKLAKLLRFYSSALEASMTSLDDYNSRMKEGQKALYYMVSSSTVHSGASCMCAAL